ncbi:4a-hydroxytetrahydrobiopterin dehydratase [Pengzhenrongella sp.]|jgi:4a-hydroxytetrahydrobiopterin dehydratase|uniref:4a-hydroxytetrahydrobiopterin dehydratase n=1 Tax=Pengzhenrongella sp. TaxID=2888820 RepID=UPI002F939BF0
MNPTKLSQEEVQAALADLSPDWLATDTELRRTVEFPSFLKAVEFVSEMAPIAERLDHHPDLTLSWRTVELTLSTHSSGGLTQFDLTLATDLDQLIARLI